MDTDSSQHPSDETLFDFVEGTLTRGSAGAVEEHLASCSTCASTVAQVMSVVSSTSTADHVEQMPADRAATMHEHLEREWSRRPLLARMLALRPGRMLQDRPRGELARAAMATAVVVALVGITVQATDLSGDEAGRSSETASSPAPLKGQPSGHSDRPTGAAGADTQESLQKDGAPPQGPQPTSLAGQKCEQLRPLRAPLPALPSEPEQPATDEPAVANSDVRLPELVSDADVIVLGRVVGVGAPDVIGGVGVRTVRLEICRAYRGLHVDMVDIVMPTQTVGSAVPPRGANVVVFSSYRRLGSEPVDQLTPLGGDSGIFLLEGSTARNSNAETISVEALQRRLS